MLRHPAQQWSGRRMSRREFLRRSAVTGLALPPAAAILAACRKRETTTAGGGGASGEVTVEDLLFTKDTPGELPIFDDNPPIESGLSPESTDVLRIYNWTDYIRPGVLERFGEQYGVKVEFTKFHNMEVAVEKIAAGGVEFDVFFPTVDVLPKLVVSQLLQPINQDYIPNLQANVWPQLADPYYDKGSHYTVPYTVYQTGIGYRRDHVPDEAVWDLPNPYEIYWNSAYAGKVGIYDSYRDAMSHMLLKNGITDVNTGSQEDIDLAKQELFSLIDAVNIKATIDGTYAKMPEGVFYVHQAWSGDIVYAQYGLPKDTPLDVLGYWWPQDGRGLIGNDTIAIPKGAQNPVLAHQFLNFMLDETNSLYNFAWNLYQPPQKVIEPENLVKDGTVVETLKAAVVAADQFDTGFIQAGLATAAEDMWLEAWNEFKAGV